MVDRITLAHGSGGHVARALVEEIIYPIFKNNGDNPLLDAALFAVEGSRIAFTTDSFVISPIFFPGGNIGKLAACGTINDLAVMGATPKYLSVALIIEEGLPVEALKRILYALQAVAEEAGVQVVTGDTKVVGRGQADQIYINTTGIGVFKEDKEEHQEIKEGDAIIVSGTMGDHAMAILCKREGLSFDAEVQSDCAPLHALSDAMHTVGGVKLMRDPTRGGLAGVLQELAELTTTRMEILEPEIPVHPTVTAGCRMLGLDPLYLANEGKLVAIVQKEKKEAMLACMRNTALGKRAACIGSITGIGLRGQVFLETELGVKRLLRPMEGEHLPRIC